MEVCANVLLAKVDFLNIGLAAAGPVRPFLTGFDAHVASMIFFFRIPF